MTDIVDPQVVGYIRDLVPEREGLLKTIEDDARARGVPIVQPEVAALLYCLACQRQGGRVLEIGTATGYSAIWLARGVGAEGEVVTIELEAARAEQARFNFAQMAAEDLGGITLVEGDALNILPTLEGTFDMVFIDAAKGQYPGFLEQAERLLVRGGTLVADNVLFRGLVARPDSLVDRRYRTLVRRLREFQQRLTAPAWVTAVLPIGDGVSVSYKNCK